MSSLLQQFVDDRSALTDEDLELLCDQLEEDSDLTKELGDSLEIDQLLRIGLAGEDSFREDVGECINLLERDDDFAESVALVLDKGSPSGRRRTRYLWLSIAASIAIAVGIAFLMRPRTQAPQIEELPVLVEFGHGVILESETASRPASVNTAITDGETLVCGRDSQAVLRYADGTEITVYSGSRLQLEHNNRSGKDLRLEHGRIRADVRKQTHGQEMKVWTSTSVATVLGTVFYVEAEAEHSALTVEEGVVEFKRSRDKKKVSVTAHQVAMTKWEDFSATASMIAPYKESMPDVRSPYKNTPLQIPGRIEAEDFDLGGNRVAYYSSHSAGSKLYRIDDIDIQKAGNGHAVHLKKGIEWLEYTVNTKAGKYDLNVRIATPRENLRISFSLNGKTIAGLPVPETNSFGNYQILTISGLSLPEGQSILRATTTQANSLDWMEFVPSKD